MTICSVSNRIHAVLSHDNDRIHPVLSTDYGICMPGIDSWILGHKVDRHRLEVSSCNIQYDSFIVHSIQIILTGQTEQINSTVNETLTS